MINFVETTEDVGIIFKNERKRQGLTQEELAGLSGTGRRFISDLENGKQNIQTGKLILVAKALGLGINIHNKWLDMK